MPKAQTKAVKPSPSKNGNNGDLPERRKEELAVVAGRLFQDFGFAGTSVRMITKELGWSMGTLYLYAKDKEDILDIVMRRWVRMFEEEFAETERSVPDPAQALRIHIRHFVKLMNEYSGFVKLGYREVKSFSRPSLQRQVRGDYRLAGRFAGVIREGQEKGVFRAADPMFCAIALTSLAHMTVLRQWAFHEMSPELLGDSIADLVIDGLLVR